MIKKLLLATTLAFVSSFAMADDASSLKQQFFYAGLIGGYGYVDWSSVIDRDGTAFLTNPEKITGNEGGLYGADFGYQFTPHFSVEAEYVHMPTSDLDFALISNYGLLFSTASTMEFGAVTFKVIAPVLNTNFSLFADAGPAYQYQTNDIQNIGTWAPTFGGGFLYRINQHWQTEASFQYAPGTGKSVSNPMNYFVPEIYMGTLKIDYIF